MYWSRSSAIDGRGEVQATGITLVDVPSGRKDAADQVTREERVLG